ncbi:MAG: zf-TFIIB domain-containing protein [Nitrospirota bacterium]
MADERDRITPEGYNKEEEYFYRKNKELLEKTRKALDAERAAAARRAQDQPFWMVCPKCGAKLREIDLGGVKVDQCGGCGGLFFDKGEVELLTGQPAKGLGAVLKGLFK